MSVSQLRSNHPTRLSHYKTFAIQARLNRWLIRCRKEEKAFARSRALTRKQTCTHRTREAASSSCEASPGSPDSLFSSRGQSQPKPDADAIWTIGTDTRDTLAQATQRKVPTPAERDDEGRPCSEQFRNTRPCVTPY